VKIYVGNLSRDMDDAQFRQLVAEFGDPQSAAIVKDSATGESQGFGFAEFSKAEEAQAAINGLNQRDINGSLLVVNKALPPRDPRFAAAAIRGSRRE
jgi:cold-inducible RNA-binding protein